MPIGGSEHLIGHDVRMLVAEAGRILAGGEIVHALTGQPSHMRIQHADVHLLADAGALAMAQRC